MKRKIRVGLDFDGVVAYNPFRVIRGPIKWFKKRFLGKTRVSFFVPKNWWQKTVWGLMHESSIVPAVGVERLKLLVTSGKIEAHLITGRFGFLEDSLDRWLIRNNLKGYFKTINVNREEHQPHEYKLEMVNRLKLDVYIEDNLDVVEYVRPRSKVRVLWIYNLLDRNHPDNDKYPYLEKALEAVN